MWNGRSTFRCSKFRRNRKVAPFVIANVLLKIHTQTIILKGSKEKLILAGS